MIRVERFGSCVDGLKNIIGEDKGYIVEGPISVVVPSLTDREGSVVLVEWGMDDVVPEIDQGFVTDKPPHASVIDALRLTKACPRGRIALERASNEMIFFPKHQHMETRKV